VAVLSANMLVDALEVAASVVLVPSLARALHLPPTVAFWLVGAFAAGFAATVPLAHRLCRRSGHRRVFLAATAGLALASLVGALADDPAVLIAVRAVKGAGVALTAPAGLAIITTALPRGPVRRRALSTYTSLGGAGFCAGLVVSGALTEAGWRWTLAVPAFAFLALWGLAARLVPDDRGRHPGAANGAGAAAVSRLRPRAHPTLVRTALSAAAFNAAYVLFLLVTAWQLSERAGWGPWRTACAFLPAALPLAVLGLPGVRLPARLTPAGSVRLGLLLAPAGYVLWLRTDLDAHPGPLDLLPTTALLGLAFALAFPALHRLAAEPVPAALRPAATAFYQTCVQSGPALLTAPAAAWTAQGAGVRNTEPALWMVVAVSAAAALIWAAPAGVFSRRDRPLVTEPRKDIPCQTDRSSSR
jgi:MFS family permease